MLLSCPSRAHLMALGPLPFRIGGLLQPFSVHLPIVTMPDAMRLSEYTCPLPWIVRLHSAPISTYRTHGK
jgi:hypothetical protein